SRVIVLDQGRVLADLSPRELFARPELTAQARLVPPQAARIAHQLGLDPLPLTAAELREWLPVPSAVPAPSAVSSPSAVPSAFAAPVPSVAPLPAALDPAEES